LRGHTNHAASRRPRWYNPFRMNVLLAGMKHCGKSTAGAALAKRWRCTFHDIDRLVEVEHEQWTGYKLTVRELFKRHGAGYFTKLEARVVRALAEKFAGADDDHVAALGGPTPMNPDFQEALHGLGVVVYLRLGIDELFERVKRNGLPPFLHPADPAGHFADMFAAREPHYLRLADLVVDVDDLDADAVVDLLARRIKEYTHGG